METLINIVMENDPSLEGLFFLSVMPFGGIRGALARGFLEGFPRREVFILSYLGSMLPPFFILPMLRPATEGLRNREGFRRFERKISDLAAKRGRTKRQMKLLALFLFTALPLPFTGIWPAALIAAVCGFDIKDFMPAAAAGQFIAAVLYLFPFAGGALLPTG